MAEKRLISDGEARRRIIAFATGLHSVVLPVDTVMMLLTQVPAVDAVEVVRCKDCKFGVIPYGDEHDGWIECSNIHGRPLFSRDGFCSLGERRTDG